MQLVKITFIGFLLYSSFSLYTEPLQYSLIQTINLIFHEAGHVLFMFFGEFLYTLGGSLTEIAIPLLITLYFLIKQQNFAAGFAAWWTSTALLSVSVYADDARSRALSLITDNVDTHDWFNLLANAGLLRYDHLISDLFLAASILALLGALWLWVIDLKLMQLLYRD